jgi:ParB family chromosome partitioning protein
MDRSTLANFMRLLELPGEIQDAVSRGTISMGHARALLALSSERDRRVFAARIEKEGMSVRRLENIIKISGRTSRKRPTSKDPLLVEISHKLSEFFGTRVRLETGKKRGRILIDYYDMSQLDGILKKLNIIV